MNIEIKNMGPGYPSFEKDCNFSKERIRENAYMEIPAETGRNPMVNKVENDKKSAQDLEK